MHLLIPLALSLSKGRPFRGTSKRRAALRQAQHKRRKEDVLLCRGARLVAGGAAFVALDPVRPRVGPRRSAECRVGKECVRTFRTGGSPHQYKKTKTLTYIE